jgi:hypothetical protein
MTTTPPPGYDSERRDPDYPGRAPRDPAYQDPAYGDPAYDERIPGTPGPTPTPVYRRRGAHQWLALVVGIIFLLIGLAGFAITGFDEPGRLGWWTEHDESWMLLVFAINPLHNVVHLLIGLLGVLLWPTSGGARTYGWLLAIGYGAAFVYGLMVRGDEQLDVLNINWADNWLHLASAVVGLVIALWPRPTYRADEVSPPARGTYPAPGSPTY